MIHINESNRKSHDVVMAEDKSIEDDWCKTDSNIFDIKKITNKLSTDEILHLINRELDIETHSLANPFKIKEKLDKQLINELCELQQMDKIESTFCHRKVRSKLTPNQIKYIASEIYWSTLGISELSAKYKISKSLLYKIREMSESDFSRRTSQPSNKILGNELKILIRCIERFVRNRMHPYNVKDVRQYVYHNMGKHYQYSYFA